MFKKFLGGAYSQGDNFNVASFWEAKDPTPHRFAKPVRNSKGLVIGYKKHPGGTPESIGVWKAVNRWNKVYRARFNWTFWLRWWWLSLQVWFIRNFYGRML